MSSPVEWSREPIASPRLKRLKLLAWVWWVAAVLVAACPAVGAVGCATSSSSSARFLSSRSAIVPVGDRPVTVHIPVTYNSLTRLPLVLVLHGYTGSGADVDGDYFKLSAESAKRGFLYATPDGTLDKDGNRFWNATDVCCDFFGSQVDDSAYLNAVIDSISAHFAVDTKRVYVLGLSNGAFMAYRLACDHADKIAAIVSLSGAMWNDPTRCTPTKPVGILEIHGTMDDKISYGGGDWSELDLKPIAPPKVPRIYPAATQTVVDWVAYNGCAAVADTTVPPLGLDTTIPGATTTILRYAEGCRGHVRVELWSIQGGVHTPTLSVQFLPAVLDFLYAHTSRA
jgi:polyhydroxybutyrate depolymerase